MEEKTSGNRWSRTKDDWISIWRKTHGDKFDYSKVPDRFVTRDKITIICPHHGEFRQIVSSHYKNGCNECAREKNRSKRPVAKEVYEQRLLKKFPGLVITEFPDDPKGESIVKFECSIHGPQESKLKNLQKATMACQECFKQARFRPPEEWIKIFRKVHGDKYDYSKADIVDNGTKITIICPEHGEFQQAPMGHSLGQGCQKCYDQYRRGKARKVSKEEFIARAKLKHGDKYDYTETIVGQTLNDKAWIRCPEHGLYLQSLLGHLCGDGCAKCSGKYNMSNKEYIQLVSKLYNEKYDLSKVEFKNNNSPIIIGCPEHGFVETNAKTFKKGHGCPVCNGSSGEEMVGIILDELGLEYRKEVAFPGQGFRFDFVVKSLKLFIEYDGEQHFKFVPYFHKTFERYHKAIERDRAKDQFAKNVNWTLLRFNFKQNKDDVKNALKKFIKRKRLITKQQ